MPKLMNANFLLYKFLHEKVLQRTVMNFNHYFWKQNFNKLSLRPDSHRPLTLKFPLTLKYCLLHFYQRLHTVWARSRSNQKIFCATQWAWSSAWRHYLLSSAQIIAEESYFLLILCIMNKIYRIYRCRWSQQCSLLLCCINRNKTK